MSEISPNQWTILERLEKGPEWIRSFQPAKPLLNDLIGKGLVERCRPHLGQANNMVRLTAAGCGLLEISPGDVPDQRERRPIVEPPPIQLGQIRADVSAKVLSVCEAFVRAVASGTSAGAAVGELAARENIQRPAIWKRLRQGGVIPEYGRRKEGGKGRPAGGGTPGYSRRRRDKSISHAERSEPRADQFVDRDPCPRCGVRGDLGCRHDSSRLGTAF